MTKATSGGRFSPPSPDSLQAHFKDLEIEQLLGQGGMGVVYRARQTKLDRNVALKILAPNRALDPIFEERFLREARTLARLSHPHIVSVYDVGRAGDYGYIVMEYVDGASLRALIRDGALSADEAVRLVPQICDAMQYAHDQGIVHRDIKPENVLVDQNGQVKIADFGIAKLMGDSGVEDANLTVDGLRLGTTGYMAPEQASAKAQVDHRADIYSLGIMFYEMLTGKLPTPDYMPPSRIREVDTRLDRVVERSLRDLPEERFQRAAELKEALEQIRQTRSVVAQMRVAIGVLAACLLAISGYVGWSYWQGSAAGVAPNEAARTANDGVRPAPTDPNAVTAPAKPPARQRAPFTAAEALATQKSWADHVQQPVEKTDSTGLPLRFVPPGEFEMAPGYDVIVSRPFYMGRTEVTVGQFRQFVGATNYVTQGEAGGEGGFVHLAPLSEQLERNPNFIWNHERFASDDSLPVGMLTYADMEKFCEWLSQKEGCLYRLPTEAEWYWAAKAGGDWTALQFEPIDLVHEFGWLGETSDNHSHPVGQKRANAWGFYDMIGNMCEMCVDGFDFKFPKGRYENPVRPAADDRRPGLGSSFADPPKFIRFSLNQSLPFHSIGFRVLREIPTTP